MRRELKTESKYGVGNEKKGRMLLMWREKFGWAGINRSEELAVAVREAVWHSYSLAGKERKQESFNLRQSEQSEDVDQMGLFSKSGRSESEPARKVA